MSTVTRRFWRVRPEVPGEGVEDGQTSAAARARVGGAGAVAALVLPVAALGAAPAQVQVGDFNRSPEIEFNAFYPGTITVSQGSRVKFTALGTAVTGAKMVSSGFLPDKNPTFTRTPGPARTARPGQLPCGA